MKYFNYILFTIIAICLGISIFAQDALKKEMSSKAPLETTISLDNLLDSIEWVESRGDANAVGDNGEAIGAYQIHKIYVREVNRILKLQGSDKRFTYADRWDKQKSREMVKIYLGHYGAWCWEDSSKKSVEMNLLKIFEVCARIHNGGPQGYKKPETKKYWEKVKARLEML